jgi:hypothetical protein
MGAPEPAAVLVTALTAPFLSALAPYVDQRSPARARVDEFFIFRAADFGASSPGRLNPSGRLIQVVRLFD